MKNVRRFLIALIVTVVISVVVLFPLSFKASLGSHDEDERYLYEWYSYKVSVNTYASSKNPWLV